MASVGQLTAAITHEINTPLGAIHSNAQIFDMLLNKLMGFNSINNDKELGDTAQQMKEANDISIMACDRVSQIIKSLKNFSKIDQAEFQEADLDEGVRSVLVLTSNLWKRKITIHEEYGSLPMVRCYPGLLNQVFMNLVVNAIQSIEKKGRYLYKNLERWGSGTCQYPGYRLRDTGRKY
jgi:signal transduction histidine kinase